MRLRQTNERTLSLCSVLASFPNRMCLRGLRVNKKHMLRSSLLVLFFFFLLLFLTCEKNYMPRVLLIWVTLPKPLATMWNFLVTAPLLFETALIVCLKQNAGLLLLKLQTQCQISSVMTFKPVIKWDTLLNALGLTSPHSFNPRTLKRFQSACN